MPAATTAKYAYEALDATGTLVKGTVDSESPELVAQSLAGQQMTPLNISVTGQGMNRDLSIPGFNRGTSLKDLAVFSRQFASMMGSGLTLLRALAILEEQTLKAGLRTATGKVRTEVQSGVTLSSSMAQHPDQFPVLMINMIRAGEAGGFLDDALDRVAKMYEADANLRSKIKSAMTYPVVVLIFSLLMGTGVIIFIVPVFEKMFAQLGGKLPLPTQIMVDLSHNMYWAGPLILGVLFGGRFLFRRTYRGNDAFRLQVDRLKLRLPVFGPLATKLAISRWSRTMGTLLHVGVPVLQALDVVGGTSGNAVISEAMEDVKKEVRTGQQMSGTLARHPLFPPMVVQMMEVGEETGQITEMLDKLADFYDHEVETTTEGLTSAMEPLLVVLLGAVIGTMVICLYLPMFSIYTNIQGN